MADWTLLKREDVMAVVNRVAAGMARRYEGVVETADMVQEACIAIATHATQYGDYVERERWDLFGFALKGDLTHVANRQARHYNNVIPLGDMA